MRRQQLPDLGGRFGRAEQVALHFAAALSVAARAERRNRARPGQSHWYGVEMETALGICEPRLG